MSDTASPPSTRHFVSSAPAARAARTLEREIKSGTLGVTLINGLVLIGARGDPALVARLLVVIVAVTALNIWLSRVGPRHLSVERIGWIRIVVNAAYTASVGLATNWLLPTWFFLPFMAIVVLDRHGGARAAFLAGVVSIVALADGVGFAYPSAFSVLALVSHFVVTAKTRTIREMLDESDEHRRQLERARRELGLANEKIQADMALLQKTEMDLRQAQKLEAVGRLAAGVAHEINTPVQFVGDSVHFLREGISDLMGMLDKYRDLVKNAPPGAPASEIADAALRAEEEADVAYLTENLLPAAFRAQEGLERVATIVRSMKEFAHPDQTAKTLVDLNRSLQATLTIARHEYKYVADVQTEFGELPPVPCFAGELNQVLLNVLVNAGHAIADVFAKTEKRGTIVVRTFVEGPHAVLQIADTGTGIPEAAREHVFEPFFTTKGVGRGTGQGLAIARTVIDGHRGEISFETELGKGTTFTIRLPVAETDDSEGRVAA